MIATVSYSKYLELHNISIEECLKNNEWVDGKGKVLKIKEMSDDHIKNVIGFLERGHSSVNENIKVPEVTKPFSRKYIKLFFQELKGR